MDYGVAEIYMYMYDNVQESFTNSKHNISD